MKAAIYPGTFDPPTVGHLNIALRAASTFDRLIIAIGENIDKRPPVFSLEQRIHFLKKMTQGKGNIEVVSFSGLLADFAKTINVKIIVRAIRTLFDFESETLQAQMNRKLGNLETFYLVVDENYRLVSSSLVREIASFGRRLQGLVPSEIEEEVFNQLNK